jgi:hypothetical protein
MATGIAVPNGRDLPRSGTEVIGWFMALSASFAFPFNIVATWVSAGNGPMKTLDRIDAFLDAVAS